MFLHGATYFEWTALQLLRREFRMRSQVAGHVAWQVNPRFPAELFAQEPFSIRNQRTLQRPRMGRIEWIRLLDSGLLQRLSNRLEIGCAMMLD